MEAPNEKKLIALDLIASELAYTKDLPKYALHPFIDLTEDELTVGHKIMNAPAGQEPLEEIFSYAIKFRITQNSVLSQKELIEVVRMVLEEMRRTEVDYKKKTVFVDELVPIPEAEDLPDELIKKLIAGLEERIYYLWE